MASGWSSNLRLDGKTVIITGASSGLGKCAAMDFYKRGARVVMPCLDIKEGQISIESIKKDTETANKTGELILKKMDLSSLESVKECASELLREEQQIDLLINNAGVLITDQKLSKDGFQIHFAVNYLGHFLFTVLLLPRLIRSSPARIVNTASGIYLVDSFTAVGCCYTKSYEAESNHGKPIERDELKKENESESKAYANSKLAVILFTMELAEKLQGTGVNVYCFHPGLVRTPMAKSFLKTFNVITRTIIKILAYPVRKSSYEGAQTLLYCALEEKLNSETGSYYSECRRRETGSKTADQNQRRELWDMTIEILGLDDINLFKSD